MTDRTPGVGLTVPRDRERRRRLYRALAEEVVAADERTAVVFESSTAEPRPYLTLRPPERLAALLAAPAYRELGTQDAPPAGFEPGSARIAWALLPSRPPRSTGPLEAWDVPGTAGLLGPDGRIEFQTFWLGGRSDGRLWVARRARYLAPATAPSSAGVAAFIVREWGRATGLAYTAHEVRSSGVDWRTAASRSLPRRSWWPVPPAVAERTAEPTLPDGAAPVGLDEGHVIALGASGAGKTTFLAEQAVRAWRQGDGLLALDLHGDLAPAIVARLTPTEAERLVAVDASRRPVAGIAAFVASSDRAAAQLVAAVKRLSPDGAELYWGFRLERIFDAFVRLVQESGGTLTDVYALLTDADRRDAARLATRSEELARFLDELGPILRRSPEFLWGAASRLAKIVLVPELAELLAPPDGGIPVEELLEAGRPVLVRLPFSSVGPEAASFAGSLVLARAYLGLAARRGPLAAAAPIRVVLDEVQGLSPRLVAEMLTEGRKFGLRLTVASQYPERLAPELRLAAAGVSRAVVAFRVPPAGAAGVGAWLGLAPRDADRLLPELPVGVGLYRDPGTGEQRTVASPSGFPAAAEPAWRRATEATLGEFPPGRESEPDARDAAAERLLLAVLGAEERGTPVDARTVGAEGASLPGPAIDTAVLGDRAGALLRAGLVREDGGGAWHLTPAGERTLGLRTDTGASRETAEHRALLLRAFRLFARRGYRLEILRQGRYDTTLPDAVLHQVPDRSRSGTPRALAASLAAAQQGWAWRFFDGRDVHVEAEVSGALRPARIRHGLAKARHRGAFPLFVVADAARAARVRRTLRAEGVLPRDGQVWVLTGTASRLREDGNRGPASAPA